MKDNSDCPVCSRFSTASKETIRKIVIGENSRLGYVGIAKIKQSLCAKCKHVGYSAQGHTVGEAGIPLDATEAGESTHIAPPLPTFFDSLDGTFVSPRSRRPSARRYWKLMHTRFLRRKNR